MQHRWLWLFPIVGALLIPLAAGVQVKRQLENSTLSSTTGTVVELMGGCPTVEFVDRQNVERFVTEVCGSPPPHEIGERVKVLYDPHWRSKPRVDGFLENWFATLVLGTIGVGFLLLGCVFVLPSVLAARRARELKMTGRQVYAEPVHVQVNGRLQINGVSPWQIVAQWVDPATSKLHQFRSENVWYDPSIFVAQQRQIRVLIDPNRPSRYHMDISFLPVTAGG